MMLSSVSVVSSNPWLALFRDWRPDAGPTIAIMVVALLYAAGVRRVWHRVGRDRGVRRAQAAWFAGGIAVLAVALVSPLLLVLGAPELALLWLLPASARRRLARAVNRTTLLRRAWLAATAPAVAWLVHAVAIWSWHLPRLYTLALRSDAAHAAEHLSFVGTGALVWWAIVHPRGQRRTAYAVGILTLFATATQTGILGALLTLTHRVWIPAQSAGAAAWGLTPIEDQQLAGLIMWVPGGLLYVVAMAALFLAWIESPSHARKRAARAVLAVGVTA